MLKRENRLTDGPTFGRAVRTGRRAGSRTLVVHVASSHGSDRSEAATGAAPRVGLVVGKAVGNAVVRNRVKRRLRHLLRERVGSLPLAALVVVRALPPAASASYAELADDLESALRRATRVAR